MKIESLTDDEAQLVWEQQQLAAVEAKLAQVKTKEDRFYYATCAAGWRRSIAHLEQRIDETIRSDTLTET
jgi:hypothetical protein